MTQESKMSAFALLLVLNLLWAKSQAQVPLPTASIEPTYMIIAPGESVDFTCTTTGATSSATWMRNNVLITNDANNAIDSAQNQLSVSNFSGDLAGNYTCIANNAMGSVSSSTAVLQIAVHDANFLSTEVASPHQVTVEAGQPTAIDCGSFTNIPDANLNWEVVFGDSFVGINVGDDRATVGLNQSLYLLEPRVQDSGIIFICILRNTLITQVADGYIQINVQASTSPVPDPFTLVRPQDVTTRLGETVSFECIPGGMGASDISVEWTVPNDIRNSRRSGDTFRLSISDVNADNIGTYACIIEGVGTFSANLGILDPPTIESALPAEPVSLIYGHPLSLTCASSLGTYWEWFQNGVRLDVTGGSLSVPSTTLEHSGAYQCIAYNSAGFAESSSQVEVRTLPAAITNDLPADQLIFRRQPFSMSCSAMGAPPPTYSWSKGDVPLDSGTSFQVGSDGSLLIREVDGSTEGTYTCTATNTLPDGQVVGRDSTATTITTIMPTVITTTNIGPLFSIQVDIGAILPCQATSEDPASVISYSWTKDDQPLVLDGRVQFVSSGSSGNLSFTSVEYGDAGVYQCVVTTMHGASHAPTVRSMDITVEVTDTPVAPHILSLNSTFPNSFHIEYIFSGMQAFISNYTIEVQGPPRVQDTPWIALQTRSSNAITAADVSSDVLKAFTVYNVRVVAVYVSGTNVSSDVMTVTTGADVPLDAPRDLEVFAPNNMALSLKWKPPSAPRGNIIDYAIQYTMKDDDTLTTISVGSNQTTYVIAGLPEFKRFTVQVAAVTTAGRGPFSEEVEAVTIEGGLEEPQGGPFVSTIGFIVLIVALVLLLVVTAVVGLLVIRYKWKKVRKQTTGRYHVRPESGIFNGKVIIGTEAPDTTDLSESAVASYTGRHKRAFNSTSPSGSDHLDMLEGESSFGGTEYTVTTGTPQLGSSARLLSSNAPSYIDPPSFEETLMKARSQSASSAYCNRDFDRPRNEWDNEEGQPEFPPQMSVFNTGNVNTVEYLCNDSDNSIEKDPMDTASDMTDQQSDHTQYSHLAGINVNPSAGNALVFHHQLKLPRSATSSSGGGGAPVSFSEMVDNRLREQSPDAGSPLNYATYV